MNGHSWTRTTRQRTKTLLNITADRRRAKVISAKKLYRDKIRSYVICIGLSAAFIIGAGSIIIPDMIKSHRSHETYTNTICIGECTPHGWWNPRWRNDIESSKQEWWSFGDGKHQYTTRDLMGRNI